MSQKLMSNINKLLEYTECVKDKVACPKPDLYRNLNKNFFSRLFKCNIGLDYTKSDVIFVYKDQGERIGEQSPID
ncbi:hypothetical protein ACTXT7_003584 [Hymenolepis weldensis]